MPIADELAKLIRFREAGHLSAAEFEEQKQLLLARSRNSDPPAGGAAARATITSFGAYELIEQVGEGGMGTVYRGDFLERFRHEADTLAKVDHPNIVKVFDIVEEFGRVGLVMEWVPGRPLSEVIGREMGVIPWEKAQPIVRPLLSAMAHVHARGVVHRDLKPDNIRVMPDGTIKVLDFGIARAGESRGRTKTGTGMGTIDYMAPEQYTDAKAVDSRADIYALGMTLYEMVAGRLPWDAAETEFGVLMRKNQGDIPPPTRFYESIPPWVVDAIMAAIEHQAIMPS